MSNETDAAVQDERMQKGVFQPSKAEIAREMKSRLYLGNANEDDQPRIDSAEGR